MRKTLLLWLLPVLFSGGCVHGLWRAGSTASGTLPGRRPDGSILLPNQWSLRPVGRQVQLADFPVNIAVHPGGRFAAVLHSGYGDHEILIVNLAAEKVASRVKLHESFYGLEFSNDGKKLFCSGAGDEVVHAFDFQNGNLSNHEEIELRQVKERGVPAGLALDRSARRLFVANLWGDRVSRVDLAHESEVTDFLLAETNTAIAEAPSAPSIDPDTAAAEKRAEAALQETNKGGAFPYACKLDEKRRRLYVSLWAQAAVDVLDLDSGRIVARWKTEEHPCEMALTRSGKFLFVANASRNTVSVLDTAAGNTVETISASLYPQVPPGSTPNSLALCPDERTLFIANADNNAIAVFDVSTPGNSVSLGFIPVGWYPTSVRVTPNGKQLLVANGKGSASAPNPLGPQPGVSLPTNSVVQYIAGLFRGTLSSIKLAPRDKLKQRLATWTAQAYLCSPLRADSAVSTAPPADSPIPSRIGDPSPIKYCLYIIKENRTYDQVLGDMPQGNGDPKLCLFPEKVTPNLHKIARDFVLLDNFYVDGEVSADGHEWSMAAYATDFVEKMWPMDYGHNRSGKFPYPSEGNFPIATPAGGYLWDRAKDAGVTYRSYGEFVSNPRAANKPATSRVPALQGHFDESFRGFDLDYWDTNRAARFISELRRFEASGDMPRLQILRLPNDHTHGTTPRYRTPTAYVADNDLAMGMVVEAVSHSKFWPQTAIFVVEDDAQNGPDHVDAHRTTAYVISPYTKRGVVDSNMYSTSSMLRTMELVLGLKPMSQFDAAARPMFACFQPTPDMRPYQALPAQVDLDAVTERHAWGGNLKLDFTREDAVDDLLLSEIVWRSVRGADSAMPPPVRAGFVFPHAKGDDD
jgi:DNA-binding beta-propeller fold protein YncE